MRAMGRVDDELRHENDFCRKLQGSSSNGILVAQAWKELRTTNVVKKTKKLVLLADLGPVVEGYVERTFRTKLLQAGKPMLTSLNWSGISRKMRSELVQATSIRY